MGHAFLTAFWDDKLWNVTLFFDNERAFERLKWAMSQLYGTSEEVDGDCMWIGNETMMLLLKADFGTERCLVRISSIGLMAEMSKAEVHRGW